MYQVHWKYTVNAKYESEFEALYGPKGDWVRLFERSPFYVATFLYQCNKTQFETIDIWLSKSSYLTFYRENQGKIQAIDDKGDRMTTTEIKFAEFEYLP